MILRNTRSTWFHYCRDIMLKYMDSTFETLERRENSLNIRQQIWLMKIVETFPVAVHNQTVETLVSIIKDWIPPSTVILNDCWASHSTLCISGTHTR